MTDEEYELWERVAIMEFDGGLTHEEAYRKALAAVEASQMRLYEQQEDQ